MQFLRALGLAVAAASALLVSSDAAKPALCADHASTVTPAVQGSFCAEYVNISATNRPAELLVGVVESDTMTTLDFIGPTTYFEFYSLAGFPVRFVSVSNRTGRIQPDRFMAQHATHSYVDAPTKFDVLIFPALPGDILQDAGFKKYLLTAIEQSKYVLSVCAGAGILAATGALDGRNATTNKSLYKEITAAHPKVNWVRKARWTVDGKFWTSSGVTAGMDMAHEFISFLSNEKLASCIADTMEITPIRDPSNDPFERLIDL